MDADPSSRYENISATDSSKQHNGNVYNNTSHTTNYHGFTPQQQQNLNASLFRASPPHLSNLLNQGADPNARDRLNLTPLHHAAFLGNVTTVTTLLDAGADAHAIDTFFGTPLCLAGLMGRLEVVELLIERGVNLAQDCEHFGSAAHAACVGRNLDVVKLLASAGADFGAKKWVSGVIEGVLEGGYKSCREFPAYRELELGTDKAKLFVWLTGAAAGLRSGGREVVTFCAGLERGLRVREEVEGVVFGDLAREKVVMRKKGVSVLMVAATSLDVGVLEVLLERGADARWVSEERESAVLLAVGSGRGDEGFEASMRLLVKYGADLDARHAGGTTALMVAMRQVTGPVRARVLLEIGAGIDLVDAKGESALMCAVRYSPMETRGQCVELLCQYGAEVQLRNSSGCTALDLARERSGSDGGEVQSILLRYGAGRFGSERQQASPRGSVTVRSLSMALLADVVALANKRSGRR
jgi:ankyrin repeat protein